MRKYICSDCRIWFRTRDIREHLKVVDGEEVVMCSRCVIYCDDRDYKEEEERV